MGLRSCMKDTCCWRWVNSKSGKLFKFFLLLILDLIDVGVDWYFYTKVELIQPGLVYGPPSKTYKLCVFIFCIVSSLTLLIETIQNIDDLFVKKKIPFLTQSVTNFLNIICEDIPLLTLNLILTLCRDGDVSIVSLVKSSICIVLVCIRFLLMIVSYWIFEKKRNKIEYAFDLISTIGLIVAAFLSISIQLFNNFPTDNKGVIIIGDPKTFDRQQYFAHKYLDEVGIYTYWPLEYDDYFDRNASSIVANEQQIWLADINDIIDNKMIMVNIRTSTAHIHNNDNYTLCIEKSINLDSVYDTNKNKTKINCWYVLNNTYFYDTDVSIFASGSLKHGYNVVFAKRSIDFFKYLLGYIDYNIVKYDNCSGVDVNMYRSFEYAKYPFKRYNYDTSKNGANIVVVDDDDGDNNSANLNATSYLRYYEGVGYYMMFDKMLHLNHVDKIWRTGILSCKSVGDKGPKYNQDLKVTCD